MNPELRPRKSTSWALCIRVCTLRFAAATLARGSARSPSPRSVYKALQWKDTPVKRSCMRQHKPLPQPWSCNQKDPRNRSHQFMNQDRGRQHAGRPLWIIPDAPRPLLERAWGFPGVWTLLWDWPAVPTCLVWTRPHLQGKGALPFEDGLRWALSLVLHMLPSSSEQLARGFEAGRLSGGTFITQTWAQGLHHWRRVKWVRNLHLGGLKWGLE